MDGFIKQLMTGRLGGGLSVWSCCSSNMLLAAKKKKNTSMGIMDSKKKTKTGTTCFFWLMNYGGFPKKLLSLQPIYGDPGCKMRVIDGYVVWDLVEFHGNYYKL